MGRQVSPVQINTFVGGLVTEGNLLNFPLNATTDEVNMEITSEGYRFQRVGFKAENNYTALPSCVYQPGQTLARSTFLWIAPGGYDDQQICVVQIGNYLGFHRIKSATISSETLYTKSLDTQTYSTTCGIESIDGTLVVATGEQDVIVFTYDGSSIEETVKPIHIRDFFGVEDKLTTGENLLDPQNFQVRPRVLTRQHMYNLRNQTFALPRMRGDANVDTVTDPIAEFHGASGGVYVPPFPGGSVVDSQDGAGFPSNADNLVAFLQADANLVTNRTAERFKSFDMFSTKPPNFKAPTGYFIIDAFRRGQSREEELSKLKSRNPKLIVDVAGTLPTDEAPDGPTVLGKYAGRVWYAGMTSQVTGGDSESPRYNSYVFFSQIVNNPERITRCYQQADPTHYLDPELVDDDGGFVKIDGAYGITKLVTVGTFLFVFAANGVWAITGIDNNTFTATGYSISKVSEFGCINGRSVVIYNESVFYFGEEAIYLLSQDQIGNWGVQDISEATIKTLYLSLSPEQRVNASGYYDYRTNSVRWVYGVDATNTQNKGQDTGNELILNVKFQAFTVNRFVRDSSVFGVIAATAGQKFTGEEFLEVTVGGEAVTVDGITVTTENVNRILDPREGLYIILLGINGDNKFTYTFGGYDNSTLQDWGISIPEAYLITGPVNGGDGRLRKNVPYLTAHFPSEGSNLSCLLSARWGWSNSLASGKWSSKRSVYRNADDNFSVVTTRNKIRGFGPAVSFLFESDGVLPLKIYGWEFNLQSNTDE